ncbi:thiamin pyrophosphokinase 1 isoform X1 [Frankliniella occidentalis]|uniref:Thiamin pyrophosphokinase 1 isoform X1 n=1 Tax=Frankliniella occidentalis TaxID=133901 RepID=A0A6J1S804_FRAOC|nr:thiamin pyrophosphokinase 1 isoform X1 [Frankliniella occidentalis]
MDCSTLWEPLSFLGTEYREPFTLVILNQPISIKKEVMVHLWNNAVYRITVDGGTDRWLDWLEASGACGVSNLGLPDLITGDFDSIRPDTMITLKEKSVCFESTPDQDLTDFSKAVKCAKEKQAANLIIAICEVSGRLDQILSQLNTLHTHEERIVLLSSCSATWLLRPGSHEIYVSGLKSRDILSHDRWIGLIPVGAPSRVTTSGLKWNLDNTEMKFGGLISSSNTYSNDPVIKIKTDQPLIWSMGIDISNNKKSGNQLNIP